MENERKLATIRRVKAVRPIKDADNIEAVDIDGWTVVTQKSNNFKEGDTVLYLEIDSFIDVTDPRFEFLAERGVKTNKMGEKGHVLKTIRLKGTYSQGLILPLAEFLGDIPESGDYGEDLTEVLGIKKWEPPIPANLRGNIEGRFPDFMRKTDAERIQNLGEIFPLDAYWIATEKIDGTSATYGLDVDGKFWVCSRNLALKETEGNLYWEMAKRHDIEGWLRTQVQVGDAAVLQGEIYGEGIGKNPLGVKGHHFSAFNFQSAPNLWGSSNLLMMEDYNSIRSSVMPEWANVAPTIKLPIPQSIEEALAQVDGMKSTISPQRQAEGVVWWRTIPDNQRNFKAINNKLLSKEK